MGLICPLNTLSMVSHWMSSLECCLTTSWVEWECFCIHLLEFCGGSHDLLGGICAFLCMWGVSLWRFCDQNKYQCDPTFFFWLMGWSHVAVTWIHLLTGFLNSWFIASFQASWRTMEFPGLNLGCDLLYLLFLVWPAPVMRGSAMCILAAWLPTPPPLLFDRLHNTYNLVFNMVWFWLH